MRFFFLILLLSLVFNSCKLNRPDLKVTGDSSGSKADYNQVIDQIVLTNNFSAYLPISTTKESLFFYISDSQCTDCILSHLKIISQEIKNEKLKSEQFFLLTEYSNKTLLKAHLLRADLSNVETLNVRGKELFKDLPRLYDLPTFFIYHADLGLGHSLYQAQLGKEILSSNYLKSVIKRLN